MDDVLRSAIDTFVQVVGGLFFCKLRCWLSVVERMLERCLQWG